jgi:A/G-specific adenine glycosylase
MLLVQNQQGEVLLERRPPTGIWGGLLSLPEVETVGETASWCRRHLGAGIDTPIEWPELRHRFSHFELVITPVRLTPTEPKFSIRESDNLLWVSPKSPGGGLPAPVNCLIKQFISNDKGAKNGTHG